MATIIFDIDGVFVPFYARYNPDIGFTWHGTNSKGAFLKPEMQIPWLTHLAEKHTLVWGSAWREESNLILGWFNLPGEWEHIPLQTEDVGLGTWKIRSVKKWVDQNVPAGEKLIWVDDELEQDAFTWAEERGNMLVIAPLKDEGLTPEHYSQILRFLEEENS